MKFVRILALASAVVPLVALSTEASAKTRWTLDFLFPGHVEEPPEYSFYGDRVIVDDEFDDEFVRPAPRRFAEDPYEFDENYYEPELKPRKPLKERMKAQDSKAPKLQATAPKTTTTVKTASANDAGALPAKKNVIATPSKTVSCDKAATIVGGYGFSGVKSKTCSGKVLVFTATRSGKNYEVSVSSASGELTEVKRL